METQEPVLLELVPASRGKRFANLIIDIAGFYAFLLAVMSAIGFTAPNFLERWKAGQGLAFGTNLVVFFLYYVICEGLTMRSPGKFLTGTKVVSFDGGVPGFGQIAFRTILRHLPFEWLPLFSEGEDGIPGLPLHDRWSGTLVVSLSGESEER